MPMWQSPVQSSDGHQKDLMPADICLLSAQIPEHHSPYKLYWSHKFRLHAALPESHGLPAPSQPHELYFFLHQISQQAQIHLGFSHQLQFDYLRCTSLADPRFADQESFLSVLFSDSLFSPYEKEVFCSRYFFSEETYRFPTLLRIEFFLVI